MSVTFKIFSFSALAFALTTVFMNCTGPVHIEGSADLSSADVPRPAAPSGLKAVAASSVQIDLSWIDNSSDEIGFVIERASHAGGPFAVVGKVVDGAVIFQDTKLTPSTTHHYRVAAFNAGGNSPYTNVVSGTTAGSANSAPSSPSNLTASGTSGAEITLKWTDGSVNETGFKIERSTASAGPFQIVGAANAGQIEYIDSNLAPLTTYYYRILAFNEIGSSGYSNTANATTL